MYIYLLYSEIEDETENTLLGAYKEISSAREALWDYVLDTTFQEELENTAADNGYDSIEEFGKNVLCYSDYDEDLGMRIDKVPLK